MTVITLPTTAPPQRVGARPPVCNDVAPPLAPPSLHDIELIRFLLLVLRLLLVTVLGLTPSFHLAVSHWTPHSLLTGPDTDSQPLQAPGKRKCWFSHVLLCRQKHGTVSVSKSVSLHLNLSWPHCNPGQWTTGMLNQTPLTHAPLHTSNVVMLQRSRLGGGVSPTPGSWTWRRHSAVMDADSNRANGKKPFSVQAELTVFTVRNNIQRNLLTRLCQFHTKRSSANA